MWEKGPVSVYMGCSNKIPHQWFISSQLEVQNEGISRLVSSEAFLLGLQSCFLTGSSHGLPSVHCTSVSLSPPLRRTPVHWVGVHAYSLVLLQSPLKGPISIHSRILRSSGSGLQHVNLGRDTVQVTTLCPQTSSTTGFYKIRWVGFFVLFCFVLFFDKSAYNAGDLGSVLGSGR